MQQLSADWQIEVFVNHCCIRLLCEIYLCGFVLLQYVKLDGDANTESDVLGQHWFSYTGIYSQVCYKISIGYVSIEENNGKYHLMKVLLSIKSCFPLNFIIPLIWFDLPLLYHFPAKTSDKFYKQQRKRELCLWEHTDLCNFRVRIDTLRV